MKAARGFTLVELLVVMTLLSLLMLGMAGAVRGMGKTEERIDARLDQSDELRTAVLFLRASLERVSARRLDKVQAGANPFPFAASSQEMVWVGVMPARFGAGGRHFFKLGLEAASEGRVDLVIRYLPLGDGTVPPDWSRAEFRALKKDVAGWSMRFQDTRAAGAPWLTDWPIKDRHPGAVQLSVQTRSGVWPPIIISMRVMPGPDDGSTVFVTGGGRN